METVNEATQLYILASEILGPKPKSIPRKIPNPNKTYYQLAKEGIVKVSQKKLFDKLMIKKS